MSRSSVGATRLSSFLGLRGSSPPHLRLSQGVLCGRVRYVAPSSSSAKKLTFWRLFASHKSHCHQRCGFVLIPRCAGSAMFEQLFKRPKALARQRTEPLADERRAYLAHL